LEKSRLDTLLVQKGIAASREKARALIMAGEVKVNGLKIDKPGTTVSINADIQIKDLPRYVSRGGLKLEKAIREFMLDFTGKTVLDVGASTGGYTDCALQHGAARVYALDVGYGQLDWALRNDPRVVNIEKTNIRYFKPQDLGVQVDIITVDVSFISTELVFPVIKNLVNDNGIIISLIKPQFEAGKELVGKHGVVRNPETHCQVLAQCIHNAWQQGLTCTGITYSPITGPKGNIEYFIKLDKFSEPLLDYQDLIKKVVQEAHTQLGRGSCENITGKQ
jgi:23S rRNA (cytidine1920-2'-O)/16S rRNA (cytidine1409-2'-O)-methyltransferase